jgi:hypothetical protein
MMNKEKQIFVVDILTTTNTQLREEEKTLKPGATRSNKSH